MTEELTNFADAISNNNNLDVENRMELHSFLQLGNDLSFPPLKIALVQHATSLQTQQMVREVLTVCTTLHKIVKSVEDRAAASFTDDQILEIRSACKFVLFDHTRVHFDNDAIVKAATAYLKKHKNTNGFKDAFGASNKGREKALGKAVRDAASYAKALVRNAILASMPGNKRDGVGAGLTALVTSLAKKCTGLSENATTKEAIWCAILRHIVREDPRLAGLLNSDELQDAPPVLPARPPKRNRDGVAKQGRAADGNDFFSIIEDEFKKMRLGMGDDWKGSEWVKFIDYIIGQERSLWPSDTLPLIPQAQGAPPSSTSASGSSRSAGLTGVYATRPQAPDARPLQSSSRSNTRSAHRLGSDSHAGPGPSRMLYPDDIHHLPVGD
ncbi:hypothetical protein DFH07DRAFT_862203 [Mycena maculata]|uniref:Uncharacterized protein n=1 Tax=Mycena maculata TaxID=230809 RepID=A0AAD7HBG5_9AGAR|nr:hypothetical protein DFH07DRAFT_862203 [Mycena maculata]